MDNSFISTKSITFFNMMLSRTLEYASNTRLSIAKPEGISSFTDLVLFLLVGFRRPKDFQILLKILDFFGTFLPLVGKVGRFLDFLENTRGKCFAKKPLKGDRLEFLILFARFLLLVIVTFLQEKLNALHFEINKTF